jgi:hypothetical protein
MAKLSGAVSGKLNRAGISVKWLAVANAAQHHRMAAMVNQIGLRVFIIWKIMAGLC